MPLSHCIFKLLVKLWSTFRALVYKAADFQGEWSSSGLAYQWTAIQHSWRVARRRPKQVGRSRSAEAGRPKQVGQYWVSGTVFWYSERSSADPLVGRPQYHPPLALVTRHRRLASTPSSTLCSIYHCSENCLAQFPPFGFPPFFFTQ